MTGKPASDAPEVASDADGEVARGLETVGFACGLGHLLKGGFSENVSTGVGINFSTNFVAA
jgi:malonate-semialdehyde dehydrogenase (acetylating)/methylmalonate-semialdehyde dehydrogenase